VAEIARVVAVLGYSGRGAEGLHPVCALRLAHAERLAEGARAVVLSGEAELMRVAWSGPNVPLICDPAARNTAENALAVAAVSRELGAAEVVVVTSWWHRPRAWALVRAALHGTGIGVRTSSPSSLVRPGQLVRELMCLAALPLQVLYVKRAASSRRRASPRWTRYSRWARVSARAKRLRPGESGSGKRASETS